MAITTASSTVDNINNFTAAGKAAAEKTKSSVASLITTADQFLKLLTVQLQNQDPTKPLETDQITSQITGLSQVQQQIDINTNLQSLMAMFSQNQLSNMVSYIGKYVEAPGNLSALQGGTGTFVYTLDAEAKDVQVAVSDAQGNVVFSGTGTKLAGRNTFAWDGKNNEGQQMADGVYKLAVKATGDDGKAVGATTSSFGKVTSVESIMDETGALRNDLALGDILVPLDQIISVRS